MSGRWVIFKTWSRVRPLRPSSPHTCGGSSLKSDGIKERCPQGNLRGYFTKRVLKALYVEYGVVVEEDGTTYHKGVVWMCPSSRWLSSKSNKMVTGCVRKGWPRMVFGFASIFAEVTLIGIFVSLLYFTKAVANEVEANFIHINGLKKQKRPLVTMVISLVAKAERWQFLKWGSLQYHNTKWPMHLTYIVKEWKYTNVEAIRHLKALLLARLKSYGFAHREQGKG
ncbi:hypothetical protein Tco_0420589 [Tanacetum coccineum]